MRFSTVCSGIGAPEVAWATLGWTPAFMSEIAPFPRAVLAHRFSGVPLHGDFTTIKAGDYADIDVLCGGTPCQSFSVAGLRGGMDDERGNLALEYLRLADRLRPFWILWENVPGVLSSNGGRDFGAFIGALGELGYGWAYRSLDAQYFGLAQRRERVFVVGCLGDWRRAAAVLFKPSCLRGHPSPRRKAGAIVTALTASGVGTCGADDNQAQGGHLIADPLRANGEFNGRYDKHPLTVSKCLTAKSGFRSDAETETFVAHTLRGQGFDASEDGTGRGTPLVAFSCKDHGADAGNIAPTLRAMGFTESHANGGGQVAVAFGWQNSPSQGASASASASASVTPTLDKSKTPAVAFQSSQSGVRESEAHATLDANNGSRRHNGVVQMSGVRRLTPTECEKLQGFPPHWTDVPYRGKRAADGPRYAAIGNSMAVPVIRWIGERIAAVHAATRKPV